MHGIIFSELEKYTDKKLGAGAWKKLVAEAGLGTKTYLVTSSYPDTEAVALITTASRITNLPVPAILEDFGAFIVPSLLSLYKPLVKKDWKTLDLIEHTEETIHKVVRLQNPGAAPPALIVKRLSPREVVITYTSQRKMCGIAKGIAKGIAAHFHEKITIGETTCMLRGDPSCVIAVKLA